MSQNNTERTNTTYNENEVGCCWEKRSSKSNNPYLSLKINIEGKDYFLKGFLNAKKTKDDVNNKQPTWILFESTFKKDSKSDYNQRDIEDFNK